MVCFQLTLSQDNNRHIVWERTGHQAEDWLYGCADITGFQGEITLEIIGTRGDGPLGDIAIDDVGLSDICPR